MPTYTVTFRANNEFAETQLEAPTPGEAIEQAKAMLETHRPKLEFFCYDDTLDVNEIEVEGANPEDCAVWQSEELRLHFASDSMFDALSAAACPVSLADVATTTDVEALRRIALWFRDWSVQHRAPAIKLAEEGCF